MFNGVPYIAADDGHGIILAHIMHSGEGNYEGQLGNSMADARLMAGAPDMYAALEAFLDISYPIYEENYDQVKAAIDLGFQAMIKMNATD